MPLRCFISLLSSRVSFQLALGIFFCALSNSCNWSRMQLHDLCFLHWLLVTSGLKHWYSPTKPKQTSPHLPEGISHTSAPCSLQARLHLSGEKEDMHQDSSLYRHTSGGMNFPWLFKQLENYIDKSLTHCVFCCYTNPTLFVLAWRYVVLANGVNVKAWMV